MRKDVVGIADVEVEELGVGSEFHEAVGQLVRLPGDQHRVVCLGDDVIRDHRQRNVCFGVGGELHDFALHGTVVAQIERGDPVEIRRRRLQVGEGDLLALGCRRDGADEAQVFGGAKFDLSTRRLVQLPGDGGAAVVFVTDRGARFDRRLRQIEFRIRAEDGDRALGSAVAGGISGTDHVLIRRVGVEVGEGELVVDNVVAGIGEVLQAGRVGAIPAVAVARLIRRPLDHGHVVRVEGVDRAERDHRELRIRVGVGDEATCAARRLQDPGDLACRRCRRLEGGDLAVGCLELQAVRVVGARL